MIKKIKSTKNKQQLQREVEHYQQALRQKPNSAELYFQLALVLHKLGKLHDAQKSYQQTITLNPDNARAYFQLGLIDHQAGQLEAAVANYRQAIARQPDYIEAYSNLGSALAGQKKYPEAVVVYQQALLKKPLWATLHNNLGQVFYLQGKLADAIDAYKRAIELEPKMILAYQNLGKLWLQQQNPTEAVKCFERVITLQPNKIIAYSDCAVASINQGKLEQAMAYLKKAIALEPEFITAYCQRISQLREDDLLERAQIACINFLMALQQKVKLEYVSYYLWLTYIYLGEVLAAYGNYQKAEKYYQKALQIKRDEAKLYLRLGDCLAQQQRWQAAINIYHRGLIVAPNHPQLIFHLASTLEKQGSFQQAIDYYEQLTSSQVKITGISPLANLFPRELSLLPQGIYPTTADWLQASSANTQLQGLDYAEVTWDISPSSPFFSLSDSDSDFSCGGLACANCMGKLIGYFQPIQVTRGVYRVSETAKLPIPPPKTFTVTIPEGRAWVVPQENDWMICNTLGIISPDGYLLGDLSRFAPWYLPGCQKHDLDNHSLLQATLVPPLEKIEGTTAMLTTLSGHIYYHWLIDLLPRIEILRRSGQDLAEIDWFVVNSLRLPFQRETLQLLGIPMSKIIESDRHPHLQAKRLIVPSFPGHLDWVSQATVTFLRDTFLAKINQSNSDSPRRIYITRRGSKHRQIINEAQVSQILTQFGFIIVSLEKLAFLEQIKLFANANAIVAAHGSGLTNIVFCQEGTQIVEIFSPNYLRTDYWMISQQLKLQHYYIKGERFQSYFLRKLMYQTPLTEDILVNINALYRILSLLT